MEEKAREDESSFDVTFVPLVEANQPFIDFVKHYYKKGGLRVDIGCGDKKIHPTFVGVDPYVEHEDVDIKAYMWNTPFIDNCVDLLICFSALEHVSKYYIIPSLQEFARILKPGAAFAIIVPNLMYCLTTWLQKPTNGWEMDLIFGHQLGEGEVHRTGFSLELIKAYFEQVPELEILNIYDINAYTQWNFGIIGIKKELNA